MNQPQTRAPGRPRSERAEKAILEATLDLLAEESGVAGVSMEAVAARAGVGKTTIYRRWTSKEDLIVGALASVKAPLHDPESGSVRDDLLAIARTLAAQHGAPYARCFWSVVGGAEKHPRLYARYWDTVIAPRRELIRRILRRGVHRGELRDDLDPDAVTAMLTGAFTQKMARAFTQTGPEGLGGDFAETLVDTLMRGIEGPAVRNPPP